MFILMTQEIRQLHDQQNTQIVETQSQSGLNCDHPRIYISLSEALRDPNAVCHLNLSSQPLQVLPDSISSFKNIQTLNIANTKIDTIPGTIADLKNLKVLDIRNTPVSENEIAHLHQILPDVEIKTGTTSTVAE